MGNAATMGSRKAPPGDVAWGAKSSRPAGTAADSRAAREPGPARVSGRWLLVAIAFSIGAAAVCGWLVLCLLFWQGSWQLLYHPAARVVRTPADAGLTFGAVEFAATDTGVAQLSGWWIPAAADAPYHRFTFIYLHNEDGNLGGTVDAVARLHALGVNVLALDYRGYGKSHFARPSEAHWREDAESSLQYLVQTRHINPAAIVLDGTGLGANLALEVAAQHASLAGVVVESPESEPMGAVFDDARARLVPARLLNHDRYDLNAAARELRIPLLWIAGTSAAGQGQAAEQPAAYKAVPSPKMLVWLDASGGDGEKYADALTRWLDGLRLR